MYKDILFLDGIDDDYRQSVINFIEEWESYAPTLTISTSGTTGIPKTIEFSKKQIEASAKYTGQFFDFKNNDTVLLNLSPKFVAGKLMLVRALVYKMKIIVAPLSSNPLKVISELPQKIKLAAFVPLQVTEILNDTRSKVIYEKIENVIIGGAEISHSLEKQIAALANNNFATFGMTETLTHFALRPVDNKTDFYTCLPGIKIDQDERGCLVVESNEILANRFFSNDCIVLIDDMHFKWIGRIDNVINSGAVKIFPETDEKLIENLFDGIRFYISSTKNKKFGEETVLMVEGNGWNEKQQDEVLKKIEKLLPKYHAPKSIKFYEKFEETKNGKIIRQKFP